MIQFIVLLSLLVIIIYFLSCKGNDKQILTPKEVVQEIAKGKEIAKVVIKGKETFMGMGCPYGCRCPFCRGLGKCMKDED